jgi:hypothetical protein
VSDLQTATNGVVLFPKMNYAFLDFLSPHARWSVERVVANFVPPLNRLPIRDRLTLRLLQYVYSADLDNTPEATSMREADSSRQRALTT